MANFSDIVSHTSLTSASLELHIPAEAVNAADARFVKLIDTLGTQLFSTELEKKKIRDLSRNVLMSLYARTRVS